MSRGLCGALLTRRGGCETVAVSMERLSATILVQQANLNPRGNLRAGDVVAGRWGALIVLEGVDRAGKITQSRKLVNALQARGHRAELLRFPERTTEIGRLISSYLEKKNNLEDHTVHLLFSANRWEQVPLIKEKLNQGVTLVVDRYAFSGVAFTSAKENFSLE